MEGYTDSSYGDAFADTYDEWYADVTDVKATVEAISKLSPAGRVLELGIGTGRIALRLLEAGLDVTGVDSSQAMLDVLADKPGGSQIPTLLANMAENLPEGPFDLVLATYNTFFNLRSEAAQSNCLRLLHARLAPAGLLVLETFVPGTDMEHQLAQVTTRSMSTDSVVLSVTKPGSEKGTLDGQFVQITEQGIKLRPWSIRYLEPSALDELCTAAGFRLRERWEDWHGRAFTAESTQQIVIYERSDSHSIVDEPQM